MPVYEYLCEKCGEFEHTQRITDPPLARCPSCRRKVRRLISNTSFQLKGGGWYVTDYARAGNKGGTSGDKAPSKESSKDSGSASESASAKPSAGKTASADT
jgi:putative FmdB family regulatory protein